MECGLRENYIVSDYPLLHADVYVNILKNLDHNKNNRC